MAQRYGRDTTVITKGKTAYELKDKDCPPGSPIKLCFNIGKWNLNEQIARAEEIQHELEEIYG
ncbi:MAG: hypothetical protein IJY11_03165 [Clostridia bacterium]|nr:hypothetical protein [Clostridia bacterium]